MVENSLPAPDRPPNWNAQEYNKKFLAQMEQDRLDHERKMRNISRMALVGQVLIILVGAFAVFAPVVVSWWRLKFK